MAGDTVKEEPSTINKSALRARSAAPNAAQPATRQTIQCFDPFAVKLDKWLASILHIHPDFSILVIYAY
ncbi:hypothetical protein J40TS1_48950 [Paenibacillus montaniterrae]|uniref:Uncharacterized protein n=1 Tax=Paenibacillus montaniterrae TaxID=429341 RepID=A0A920D163_9BACL|nr:hypothetical protein J40TS1_48950 [Paenibacillus montaniterrae]